MTMTGHVRARKNGALLSERRTARHQQPDGRSAAWAAVWHGVRSNTAGQTDDGLDRAAGRTLGGSGTGDNFTRRGGGRTAGEGVRHLVLYLTVWHNYDVESGDVREEGNKYKI